MSCFGSVRQSCWQGWPKMPDGLLSFRSDALKRQPVAQMRRGFLFDSVDTLVVSRRSAATRKSGKTCWSGRKELNQHIQPGKLLLYQLSYTRIEI